MATIRRSFALFACVFAVAALAPSASANKIPPDFRSAFEGQVRRGYFAVVTQGGVPTTSVYGVDGKQTDAHFSVDVKGGRWQTSQGLFDLNQTAADSLNLGEVMEVANVTFKDKDNRIDLRMVSVEAHKVTRGSGFSQSTKREPVATNFKFFFPFPLGSARDVPQAIEHLGEYLKFFQFEDGARAYAAQVVAGGGRSAQRGSAPAAAPRAAGVSSGSAAPRASSAPKEIKPGMTALEVIDVLGKPKSEVNFQNQSKWTYPDLTVIFENGRVKEVRF